MILCIDVGNTNIKYGVFDGDRLVVSFRVATDLKRTSDQYGTALIDMFAVKGISPEDISGVIVSSVVPPLNYTARLVHAGRVNPATSETLNEGSIMPRGSYMPESPHSTPAISASKHANVKTLCIFVSDTSDCAHAVI